MILRASRVYDLPVRFSFALLMLVSAISSAQQSGNPYTNDRSATESGRGVFRIYCSPCHGMRAQGGRSGPDLTSGVFHAGDRDTDLFRAISGGVAGTEMQPYADVLTPDMIWRVVSYLRSTARPAGAKPHGDHARGEKLFGEKGGCGQCHAVGNRGGLIGPELTRIGRRRGLEHMRESIVSPSADITPRYETVTVVKRDGTKLTGIEKGLDNFSVQLMDLSQKFHSFEKREITSVTREPRSLMPDTYATLFNATEMEDLLTYLDSLQGATQGTTQ